MPDLPATDAHRTLRTAAEGGNLYAMETLGEQLVAETRRERALEEGIGWLRKAAAAGSATAMYTLSLQLLAVSEDESLRTQGYTLLLSAAQHGSLAAMTDIGLRLLHGHRIDGCSQRDGEFWLRRAALNHDPVATVLYARLLDRGELLSAPAVERRHWLSQSGLVTSADFGRLGVYLYGHAISPGPPFLNQTLLLEAYRLLVEGQAMGDILSSTVLAYLVRRRLNPAPAFHTVEHLLSDGMHTGYSFAQVNQALAIAFGVGCSADWHLADRLFKNLPGISGVLDWWSPLALDNDPEGHLVLGWLSRHGFLAEFQDPEWPARFDLARKGGLAVPNWMLSLC